eukprot:502967_1
MVSFLFFVLCNMVSTIAWIMGNATAISPYVPLGLNWTSDVQMAVGSHNGSIFIIGGYSNGYGLYEYQIKQNQFVNHGSQTYITADLYGLGQYWTQIDHKLYMINPKHNIFALFDLKTKSFINNWNDVAIPSVVEDEACLASVPDYLFVLGGFVFKVGSINAVQILQISTLLWLSETPSLRTKRRAMSCIVHEYTSQLFVMGGEGTSGKLATIEKLNIVDIPTLNQWEYNNNNLLSGCSGSRAVVFDDYIWVVGGFYSSNGQLTSVQKINVITGDVSSDQNLIWSVGFASVVMVDRVIYVFNGHDGDIYDGHGHRYHGWKRSYQYYQLPTVAPTSTPTPSPSHPTMKPTLSPTCSPTNISESPSNTPSNIPTFSPSFTPTLFFTSQSTSIKELFSSMSPSIELSKAVFVRINGAFMVIIILICILDFTLLVFAVHYIIVKLPFRSTQPGNATYCEAIQRFTVLNYIEICIELTDMGTDYFFASSLIIMDNGNNFFVLGWISLIFAIFGLFVFFFKYNTYRKLIAFQTSNLIQELNTCTVDSRIKEIIEGIRYREMDINMLSLLNGLVEDVPQAMIILVLISNQPWDHLSVLSITFSIISFVLKMAKAIATKFGCTDYPIPIYNRVQMSTF